VEEQIETPDARIKASIDRNGGNYGSRRNYGIKWKRQGQAGEWYPYNFIVIGWRSIWKFHIKYCPSFIRLLNLNISSKLYSIFSKYCYWILHQGVNSFRKFQCATLQSMVYCPMCNVTVNGLLFSFLIDRLIMKSIYVVHHMFHHMFSSNVPTFIKLDKTRRDKNFGVFTTAKFDNPRSAGNPNSRKKVLTISVAGENFWRNMRNHRNFSAQFKLLGVL